MASEFCPKCSIADIEKCFSVCPARLKWRPVGVFLKFNAGHVICNSVPQRPASLTYVLLAALCTSNQRCYQDQGVRDQDQTGRDRDQDRGRPRPRPRPRPAGSRPRPTPETETFAVLVTTSTHRQFSFIDIWILHCSKCNNAQKHRNRSVKHQASQIYSKVLTV